MSRAWPEDEGYDYYPSDDQFDEDDYPCQDEASCGAVCLGECWSYIYGTEAAYP